MANFPTVTVADCCIQQQVKFCRKKVTWFGSRLSIPSPSPEKDLVLVLSDFLDWYVLQ